MGTSLTVILTIISFPIHLIVKTYEWIKKMINIFKLNRQQNRNPSQYLTLGIPGVEFNPKAYEGKEQDYLELSLEVSSGLLTDLFLDRLVGKLSIDGTSPEDIFEINERITIKRTGFLTDLGVVTVKLFQGTQEHIRNHRQKEEDVNVKVKITGYREKCGLPVEIEGIKRTRVRKLPNT